MLGGRSCRRLPAQSHEFNSKWLSKRLFVATCVMTHTLGPVRWEPRAAVTPWTLQEWSYA
jgi:hypothetical protein